MASPPIPGWIRSFSYPGYTNAFSFLPPDCPRFYATETLFGNWQSPVLLLAKDPAPTHVMRDRFHCERIDGWRHSCRDKEVGQRTNMRLNRLVNNYLACKPLYGSVAAHMLYDHPGASRNLPGLRRGELHSHLAKVLQWVMESMPNLKAIACLGDDAWRFTAKTLGDCLAARNGKDYRDNQRVLVGMIGSRRITVSCHYHPSRGSNEEIAIGWAALSSRTRP